MTGAPAPAPWGTPVQNLAPMDALFRTEIAPGLVMSSGLNTDLACMVAEDTGDWIAWPCHLLGFVDGERRALAVVIHDGAGAPGEAELSIWPDPTLPLSRRVLRALADRLFLVCGLAAITVRVRPEDDVLQWSLTRMGFSASGRDDRPGRAARLIFTLPATTALRRAFPRGVARH